MSEDNNNSELFNKLMEFVTFAKAFEGTNLDELKKIVDMVTLSDAHHQLLLDSWTVGYEKAIIARHFNQSRQVMDEACYYAVENIIQRLYDNGLISTIHGKEFASMEECMHYYADILIKARVWKSGHEPQITRADAEGLELIVDMPVCQFLEGCKWAKESEYFTPVHNFRCQRAGSFVGAVKKYLKDGKIPSDSKPDYFMTRIHEANGCSAIVFAGRGFARRQLLTKYSMLQKENKE